MSSTLARPGDAKPSARVACDAAEYVRTQEGGFTQDELFGDWFPEPRGDQ